MPRLFPAILLAGSLLTVPAMAQQDPATPPVPPTPPPGTEQPPPPPPPSPADQPPPAPRADNEPRLPPGHPPIPPDAMRGGPEGPGDRGMRRPPPEKAGHIRIKMGRDMEIDIKCDDDGPFRECVDAAMAIVNRVMPEAQQRRGYEGYGENYRGDYRND